MSGVKIGIDTKEEIVFITLDTEEGTSITATISAKIAHMLAAQLKASATVLDKYNEEESK